MSAVRASGGSGELVLLGEGGTGTGVSGLEALAVRGGWRVRTLSSSTGDEEDDWTARLAAFLGAPDSPDRMVLVAEGRACGAVFALADRHPERAAGVVALAPEPPAADVPLPGLACPVLVLPGPADASGRAVGRFLTELCTGPAGNPGPGPAEETCPARALSPADLHEPSVMRRFAAAGPVHRLASPGSVPTWVVTGHEAARAVLAHPGLVGDTATTAGYRPQPPELASVHPGDADTITVDAGEHGRLRGLVERHLTPELTEAALPRLRQVTDELLDGLPRDREVDLVAAFAVPLPVAALCVLLGVPEPDRPYLADWLVRRVPTPPPAAHEDVDAYLGGLVTERRGRPADDLLGRMCAAGGDAVRDGDLVAAARLLLVSGARPTTTLLGNGLAALLAHRDRWREVTRDPDAHAGPVTEELLRHVTPYPVGFARRAVAPVDAAGVRIPAGHRVLASLTAANHDPAVCPGGPDPEGAPYPHASFGHGRHACLGAGFARAVARTALGTLARRFPGLDLAPGAGEPHYRRSRVRYVLALPVLLGAEHRP
ncbi:cytochrome P450 [Streptomyces tanashiensis]|uniref:Cytochrome P450 n=1 Tax=Streptomyces tanashiensis TaxID=67367 RepID=A0ABY6R662_9ACTN|nr:cytochrome P450 [Streptomyces tanashiensis]UZX25565.1 cytochrome P450 [Streptomyces tanashiensis]